MASNAHDLSSNDPFLRLTHVASFSHLYLKIEHLNVVGSIKVKAARAMLDDLEKQSGPPAGRRIIESSSGNLGIALASLCAARGYKFTCVTDANANPESAAIMRAFGADVVVITEREPNGGFLASRIKAIRAMLRDDPDAIWLNQYSNPANPRAHEATTAREILARCPRPDVVFIGVGTGGTLSGCVERLRAESPGTSIIAVDTMGSVTFGTPPGVRFIPGLGTSTAPAHVEGVTPDRLLLVDECDAIRECRALARATGLLTGGSTGTVLAAVRYLAVELDPNAVIVTLSPDGGDRYANTLYDDNWVHARGLDARGRTPAQQTWELV